ncbi:MAG: energy transducer TonB [Candidatus Binataceae bacterium]|jgi:protein TonB
MNVAVSKAGLDEDAARRLRDQACDRPSQRSCDASQLANNIATPSRRRIFGFAIGASLIAHLGVLAALTAICRPAVFRLPQTSELIYLLYTGSSGSLGSPAGASAKQPAAAAAIAAAKPRTVTTTSTTRHRTKPPRQTVATAPITHPIPPRITMALHTDAAAKSSATGEHGRDDTGAASAHGAGIASAYGIGTAGIGNGGGAGFGTVFGVDQVEHPPILLHRVMPLYPAQARARGIGGEVVLRAIIARDGHVENDIVIAQSSPMFDQPAIDALRQWHFEPGRDRDGLPVRVILEVPIRFQLR